VSTPNNHSNHVTVDVFTALSFTTLFCPEKDEFFRDVLLPNLGTNSITLSIDALPRLRRCVRPSPTVVDSFVDVEGLSSEEDRP